MLLLSKIVAGRFVVEQYDYENVKQEVLQLMSEQLELDIPKLQPQAHFQYDLGADSLDMYELIYAVEKHLAIAIPDDVAVNTETVKDLVDAVWSMVEKLCTKQIIRTDTTMLIAQDLDNQVLRIIKDSLKLGKKEIYFTSRLKQDLKINHQGAFELAYGIEKELGIIIQENILHMIKTVADVRDVVKAQLLLGCRVSKVSER